MSAPAIASSPLVRYLAPTGGLAAAVAAGVNSAVFVTATEGLSLDLAVPGAGGAALSLTLLPVIAASVLGALGAAGVFGLLSRVSRHPLRTFQIVASLLLLLSLIPVLGMGLPVSTAATLALLHLTTAAVIVWLFTTRLGRLPGRA